MLPIRGVHRTHGTLDGSLRERHGGKLANGTAVNGAAPQTRTRPLRPPTPRQQARWKAIRQAQFQGLSMRATARVLGISRVTVSAASAPAAPRAPGCGIIYRAASSARGHFRRTVKRTESLTVDSRNTPPCEDLGMFSLMGAGIASAGGLWRIPLE